MDFADAQEKASAGAKPNRALTEFAGGTSVSPAKCIKPKLILAKERTVTGMVDGIKSQRTCVSAQGAAIYCLGMQECLKSPKAEFIWS